MSEQPTEFERDITKVINQHSMEKGSDTPDFILAQYLLHCLEAFNKAARARQEWHKGGVLDA